MLKPDCLVNNLKSALLFRPYGEILMKLVWSLIQDYSPPIRSRTCFVSNDIVLGLIGTASKLVKETLN